MALEGILHFGCQVDDVGAMEEVSKAEATSSATAEELAVGLRRLDTELERVGRPAAPYDGDDGHHGCDGSLLFDESHGV